MPIVTSAACASRIPDVPAIAAAAVPCRKCRRFKFRKSPKLPSYCIQFPEVYRASAVPVGAGRSDYCNVSKIGLLLCMFAEFYMLDVVDLSGLRENEPGAVGRIAKEIGRACRDVGFFYVRNHGIPAELTDGIFGASKSFFALPAEAKGELSIAKSKHNRGYV